MCADNDMFVDSIAIDYDILYLTTIILLNIACDPIYFADIWCAVHGQIAKVSECAYDVSLPLFRTCALHIYYQISCESFILYIDLGMALILPSWHRVIRRNRQIMWSGYWQYHSS